MVAYYEITYKVIMNSIYQEIILLLLLLVVAISKQAPGKCADLRCENGGSVVKVKGKCICQCEGKYSGLDCTRDCSTRTCQNGGSPAVVDFYKCTCKCSEGFIGPRCETNCNTRKCENGGIPAVVDRNKCACNCSEGFEGKRCETKVCVKNRNEGGRECINGGVAMVTVDHKQKDICECKCLYGYKGRRCQANDDVDCIPVYQCRKNARLICPGDTCCRCEGANMCATLAAPENGGRSSEDPKLAVGATLSFTCNKGFTLKGTNPLTCQEDGTFDGAAPTCDRAAEDCPPRPEREVIISGQCRNINITQYNVKNTCKTQNMLKENGYISIRCTTPPPILPGCLANLLPS